MTWARTAYPAAARPWTSRSSSRPSWPTSWAAQRTCELRVPSAPDISEWPGWWRADCCRRGRCGADRAVGIVRAAPPPWWGLAGWSWRSGARRRGPPGIRRSPPEVWRSHRLAVDGHVGLATPHGFIGVALDSTPVAPLSISVGLGRGLAGVQRALSTRVRLVPTGAHSALGLGLGVSAGPFHSGLGLAHSSRYEYETAVWLNPDLFVERRRGPWRLRLYAGIARRVHDGACTYRDIGGSYAAPCGSAPADSPISRMPWLPFVGFSTGVGMF